MQTKKQMRLTSLLGLKWTPRANSPLPWGEGVGLRRFHQPEHDG